jgi:hypothetical protein
METFWRITFEDDNEFFVNDIYGTFEYIIDWCKDKNVLSIFKSIGY